MKKLLAIAMIISTHNLLAENSLDCLKEEGIKFCQTEAETFCNNENYNIKSTPEYYRITCFQSEKTGDVIHEATKKETLPVEETSTKTSSYETSEPQLRFAIGVGFNSQGEAEADFTNTDTSSATITNGEVTYDIDPGFSINLEARYLRKNGWGLTTGIDYDFKREAELNTLTIGNVTVRSSSTTGDKDELTNLVGYVNAVYKWDLFYIPFGLNISSMKYTSNGLDVSTDPKLGIQLGLGIETENNFALEAYVRGLGFQLNATDGEDQLKLENGVTVDLALRAKYIFF